MATLKYRPRLGIYTCGTKCNGQRRLTFNAETGEGRSFEWYSIARRLNGVLVLNSYRYSVTTSKHIHALRGLFRSLNLDFVEIDAPNGLQNLDAAQSHSLETFACQVIERKYARKKHESDAEFNARWESIFKTLAKIGAPSHDESSLAHAFQDAESARAHRLEKQRERRESKAAKLAETRTWIEAQPESVAA